MIDEQAGRGVVLPPGQTGSSFFHSLLMRAVEQFPQVFAGADLPTDPQLFKQRYATALPRFEAARIASPARAEIARFLCRESTRELRFVDERGSAAFEERLAEPVDPLPLVRVDLPGVGRLMPAVSFESKLYLGSEVAQLADLLERQHWLTRAARTALCWTSERANRETGLSLRGTRFVLLGAAAELAPAELLLQAGAEVLWIDLREPAVDRLLDPRLAGSLHYVKGGVNLLTTPQAVAATIRQFASAGPVHMGMYAYAGGETQEWRLTATMNAILRLLPSESVASAIMLISPTTPGTVSAEDVRCAEQRRREAAGWKRALVRTRQLSEGFVQNGTRTVARAIVPTQGVSYQAAQYLGKMLAAEAYAVYGNQLDNPARPLLVSANVAPITATKSLSHPVFEAAFLGAPLFDILISKAVTTRALSGLLTLHDVLNPDAPGGVIAAARAATSTHAAQVLSQQIHGGVYAQPYALDGCIHVAALRGLTQRPGLALRLFG